MLLRKIFFRLLILFIITNLYSQMNSEKNSSAQDSANSALDSTQIIKNKYSFDEKIGSTEWDLYRSKDGESPMNNLVSDIMLEFTGSDFAFINYGDIYTDFEAGPISNLDLFRLIPFNRTLVIFQMSGDVLKYLIEYSISGFRKGLAISGGIVEFDTSRYSFHRLNYFQVGDHPIYPKKIYRVVTTDYLANGNAGFKALVEGYEDKVDRTEIYLREIIGEYIRNNSPILVKPDKRWIKNRKRQVKPQQNQSRASN